MLARATTAGLATQVKASALVAMSVSWSSRLESGTSLYDPM